MRIVQLTPFLFPLLLVGARCRVGPTSPLTEQQSRSRSLRSTGGVTCRPVPDPDLEVPPFSSPYTAPDIPLDYRQQPPGGTAPEQVALFPATQNGSWVFVRYILPRGSQQDPPPVQWGTDPEHLNNVARPIRTAQYTYGLYSSGRILFAGVGPLSPSKQYWYRIPGRDTLFNFTSLPAPGHPSLHLALLGDVGQTFNSSATLRNVRTSAASLVLFAGDVTYADRYGPPCVFPAHARGEASSAWLNATQEGMGATSAGVARRMLLERPVGTDGGGDGGDSLRECGMGGLRWDSWGRMAEDTFAYKVGSFVPGNHELELLPAWGEMEEFKAYRARVPPLLTQTRAQGSDDFPSNAPLFYSMDVGPAHIVGISSYSAFTKYSHQWLWLQQDLCSVDRTRTPWLIVYMHVPLYNTNIGHYMEGESMRLEFEDWFHEAGVDLVVSGHTHAYERSRPVYRMEAAQDGCAATYVTVGDGGNDEQIDGPFLEPQPSYSAHREEWFGHAELEIEGLDTAKFSWYRNQDGAQVVGDSFTLKNQARSCGRSKPSFC